MTFSLLSELESFHDTKITESNWKREALEFQRLMLDNPRLEDLDIELEHKDYDGAEDILVHVKHEFIDTQNVDAFFKWNKEQRAFIPIDYLESWSS